MVRPLVASKSLGQNFLVDEGAVAGICDLVEGLSPSFVVEIGPGMGALTRHLYPRYRSGFAAVELDRRAVSYLRESIPGLGASLIEGDCLRCDLGGLSSRPLTLVGNLPYNISTQVLFRLVELYGRVDGAVFMLQREVARRVSAEPPSRLSGVLTVLLHRLYDVELCMTLGPESFDPMPLVHSSVIRVRPKAEVLEPKDYGMFVRVVKATYGQRRKTIRNTLPLVLTRLPAGGRGALPYGGRRPEELSVSELVELSDYCYGLEL